MAARLSWARVCSRLILMLSAFLFWNTITVSSASAQGGYMYPIYLYDGWPNPPYEVTSTYINGHVTDRHNNIIYVTLDQYDGQVYDLASNVIGFVDQPIGFRAERPTSKAIPIPAFVLFTTGLLWRIRW
jgi:hypothetical protein